MLPMQRDLVLHRFLHHNEQASARDFGYIVDVMNTVGKGELTMKKTLGILLAAMMVFAVAGCDNDDGPAEETGAKIDNAADNAGDATSDAADSVGDAASDAADSTGQAMEDAGDSISDSAEEHSN